jgi:hypothetical protein
MAPTAIRVTAVRIPNEVTAKRTHDERRRRGSSQIITLIQVIVLGPTFPFSPQMLEVRLVRRHIVEGILIPVLWSLLVLAEYIRKDR